MKTKEFIEQVQQQGYKTVQTDSYINIYDADNMIEPVASVNMYCERQISVFDDFYNIAKSLIEYAETPIAEREDEKTYYVKVFKSDFGYLNVEYDAGGLITYDKKQNNKYQTKFTETEIEQLKQRDDIPLDWEKVKLIEVEDAE